MQDNKIQEKLNYGDFQMLLYMANGYLFTNLNDGYIYAKNKITKGIIEVKYLKNQFDSIEDEYRTADVHKYENLCLMKTSLNKPTWEKYYNQIESLYDERKFDELWTLLGGYATDKVVKEGLFNDKACKNFIGTNSEVYLQTKGKADKANMDVLVVEGPYRVYKNNELVSVEQNPYQRVIDTTLKTLDAMGKRRMYNEIWINAKKGREVDPDLYDEKASLKFWKYPNWWKPIKKERSRKARVDIDKFVEKQKRSNDPKETGR